MKQLLRSAAGMSAAVMLVAACSGPGVDKSGGAAVETLVLASSDRNLDGAPGVKYFVDRVKALSGGNVEIKVVSGWEGGSDESRVIIDVAAGKADLGWSGTRAFDTVGVDAFRPLHVPFLISTYPAQAAVIGDGIGQELLSSLQPIGLEGLALMADELRRPAAVTQPLLTPQDFKGLRFGTTTSKAQSVGLAALGAQPVNIRRPHPPDTNGLDGLETMWWTYNTNQQAEFMPFVTGNVALWPRTTVVFANRTRLDGLDEQTRRWLHQAAAAATTWSAEHAGENEAAEIAAACRVGTQIATATTAQLAELRAAAEPAYEALRADGKQADTLARLEEVVKPTGPGTLTAIPTGCSHDPNAAPTRPVEVSPLTGPGRPGTLPEGTFRYTVTEDDIRGTGMPDDFARANAGVWTWKLGGGRWSYELKNSSSNVPAGFGGNTCEGYYDAIHDTASFTRTTEVSRSSGECAPPTWSGHWSDTKKGLTWQMFTDATDLDFLFGAKIWERIG